MPYCGRPSTGCEVCRIRKIKCDRAEPTCDNCAKSKWKCPGYRNTVDLLFHDESAKVVQKAKRSKQSPRADKTRASNKATSLKNGVKSPNRLNETTLAVKECGTETKHISPHPSDPDTALSCDLDEMALNYFFHYCMVGNASSNAVLEGLESSSCLKATIVALGAAAVTRSGPGSTCSAETQSRYTDAIHLTNKALASPVDVKKDSTLLAVNLLGIYEVKTGSQRRVESWHAHIQGAAALLAHRGPEQFETAEGGRLFMQTVSSLIISTICRRFEIPPYILNLMLEAKKRIPDAQDWDWRCFCLNLRFAFLYSKLLPNNLVRSPGDAGYRLEEAWDLDQEMVDLLEDAPEDWQFKVVHTDISDIFSNRIYVFPHHFAAQQYNSILYKRIILQDIMLKILWFHHDLCALQLSKLKLQQIRNASATIRQLQVNVLRSVPQHLAEASSDMDFMSPFASDQQHQPKDNLWPNFMIKDQSPWRCRPRQDPLIPPVRTCAGFSYQWPLFLVGASDALDGDVRAFAIQSLKVLGEKMGLQQAFLLADRLEKHKGVQLNAHIEFSNEIMY